MIFVEREREREREKKKRAREKGRDGEMRAETGEWLEEKRV